MNEIKRIKMVLILHHVNLNLGVTRLQESVLQSIIF